MTKLSLVTKTKHRHNRECSTCSQLIRTTQSFVNLAHAHKMTAFSLEVCILTWVEQDVFDNG